MPPSNNRIIIFADGASSGNPGPGGWGAILRGPDGRVTELGGGESSTTNNRMELTAALRALMRVSAGASGIEVYTDSKYVIQGMSQWTHNWRRNGWKSVAGAEVLNQDLWKALLDAAEGKKVRWLYVAGHSGIPANERVDEIAVAFSRGLAPVLYDGPGAGYGIDLEDLAPRFEKPAKSKNKGPGYSYLSLVGRIPMRHKTWAECEQRVRGQTGAKYKKAMNPRDEEEILKSWGFRLEDLSR